MYAATPGATRHSSCWRSCAGSKAQTLKRGLYSVRGVCNAALNYGARHRNAAALPGNSGGCGGILIFNSGAPGGVCGTRSAQRRYARATYSNDAQRRYARAVRYTLPPRRRREPALAELGHPEGASGRCSLTASHRSKNPYT